MMLLNSYEESFMDCPFHSLSMSPFPASISSLVSLVGTLFVLAAPRLAKNLANSRLSALKSYASNMR